MTNREACLARHPDFNLVITDQEDGARRVGAEWTSKGLPCCACIDMKPGRTDAQEAWFVDQLYGACLKMMLEDAA